MELINLKRYETYHLILESKKTTMKKHILLALLISISTIMLGQNVGIGTTNPDEKLTVVGTIKSSINSSSSFPHIHLHEAESEYGRIKYSNTSSSQYFTLAGNPQRDSTLARFHIFNSDFGNIGSFTGHGRFGINASNPAATFHLNSQPNTDLLRIQNDNFTKFRMFSNNAIVFGANWATPIPDVIRMETPHLFIGFDGNHIPVELLEVDGTARVKGFRMPYGQQDGYVLTSDNNGYGTWQAPQQDADSNPANEIQYLGISNHSLALSGGNSVKLSTIADPAFREVVATNRNATYPQIAFDIDAIESFVFNRGGNGSALAFMNADSNIVIKTDKLPSAVTGTGNISIGSNPEQSEITGNNNIILGKHSLYQDYTGSENIYIGNSAGHRANQNENNVIIGVDAGAHSTGDNNVAIGRGAGGNMGKHGTYVGNYARTAPNAWDNGGAFGHLATQTAHNHYVIGSEYTLQIGGHRAWSNLSDGRFKTNIKENVPGLEFINNLRPVTYDIDRKGVASFIRGEKAYEALDEEYKRALQNNTYPLETGFIAQEVERAAQKLGYSFSGVIHPQNEQDPYALAYAQFVVPLVKAVQELDSNHNILEKQNQNLLDELEILRSEVDEIKERLTKNK
jgi:hypothetical protein